MSGDIATEQDPGGGGTANLAGCEHVPDESTAYSLGSLKAVIKRDTDVRVDAKCILCGKWIRRAPAEQGETPKPWRLKYPETS